MKNILAVIVAVLVCVSPCFALETDTDSNGDIDIAFGGTNASTAAGARASLGVYSQDEVDAAIAGAPDDQTIEEFFVDGQDLVISLEDGGTKRATIPSTVITSVADYTIAEVEPLTYTCTGTTYYVSPDGDDAAAGTSTDTPWQTVGKVKSYSYSPGFSGGDCILFERGQTWTGEQLLIQGSGTTDSYVTYGSYGAGDMPTLDGTGLSLSQYHGIIRASGQDWIRIDGLRVINAGFGDDLDNACIGFQNTNNTVIQNSEVYNCEGNGIKFNGGTYNDAFHNEVHHTNKGVSNREEAITITGATYSDIVANHVYSTGFSLVGGIGIDFKSGASYGVAHHNVLHDIPGANAMYADSFSTDMTDIEFYNNLVYNTDGPGLQIGSEKTGNLSNVKAHHNIFLNCAKGGFVMHDKSDVSGEETPGVVTGVEFYNNTLYGNGDTSGDQYGSIRIIDATLTTGSLTIKNNLIYAPYNFAIGKFTSSAIPADAIVVDNNVISGNYTTATGGYTMLSNSTTTSLQGATLDIGIIGTGSTVEDFFLDSDSPAKYAGDNSVVSGTASVVDYAGNAITDGAGAIAVTGGTVSIGALEYVEPTTTVSSNVTDGTTDGQTVEWSNTSGKYEPVDQEYAEMGTDFDNDGGDGSTYATRKIFNMADALLAQYLKIADADSQSALETLLGFSFAGGSVPSPNPQTGTTYTVLTGDKGKTITGTSASAQVYTLLDEEGHWFDLINRGAGTLSLHAPTSSGVITLNGTALDAGDEADFPANAFGRVIRTGSAAWSVDAFSGTLADGGAGDYTTATVYEEDFEDTGFQTGWSGTGDPDSTTVVVGGTMSLEIAPGEDAIYDPEWSDSVRYFTWHMQIDDSFENIEAFFNVRDSSDVDLVNIKISGSTDVFYVGSASYPTTETIPANTTLKLKLMVDTSGETNSTVSLWVWDGSAWGTVVTSTESTKVNDINNVEFINSADVENIYIDNFKTSTSDISTPN